MLVLFDRSADLYRRREREKEALSEKEVIRKIFWKRSYAFEHLFRTTISYFDDDLTEALASHTTTEYLNLLCV